MSENEFNDAEMPELEEAVAHEPQSPPPEPGAGEPERVVPEPPPGELLGPASAEADWARAQPEPPPLESEPLAYEPPEPVAAEPDWALAEPEPVPIEPEPPVYEPFQPVADEPEWELAEPTPVPLEVTPASAPSPYRPAPAPYPPAQVSYQPVPGQPPLPKPGQLQTLGILTLIDGILNVLWGIGLTILLLGTIVCWPLGIYTVVLGILEIITSTKLMADPVMADKPPTWLSIMQIVNVLSGNLLSIITGILGLVFYNDVQVKNYFDSLMARRYRSGY